jgi:hypothetical protein
VVDVKKKALDEAAEDLRVLFLAGQLSKGQPWYPEAIALLTIAHQRMLKLRSME